jgi:hypothetical protein
MSVLWNRAEEHDTAEKTPARNEGFVQTFRITFDSLPLSLSLSLSLKCNERAIYTPFKRSYGTRS